jgi:TP901 family phage tail tape measure protein
VTARVKLVDLFGEVSFVVDQGSMRKMEGAVRTAQRRLDNLRAPKIQVAKFGDAASGALTKLTSAALRWGKVGAVAAAGGIAVAAKDAFHFDEALADINQSSGGAIGNLEALRQKVLDISTATGVSKEDVLSGAQSFVTLTGDAKTAAASLDVFARTAFGQKAEMSDVAEVAATMRQQFGLTADEFERGFSILSSGAKAGAVEFRDMAGLMAELGASFKVFSGSQGTGGIATLGALFQVTKQNFGSATEAATGLESLFTALQRGAKRLRKEGGIKVFEADGKTLRPILDIVDEIQKKNPSGEELIHLLGRQEAVTALRALTANRQKIDEIAQASMGARDVQTDFLRRSEFESAKAGRAWNAFKNKVAAAFTPEVMDKFVKVLQVSLDFVVRIGEGIKAWAVVLSGFAGDVADFFGSIFESVPTDKKSVSEALARQEAKDSGRSFADLAKEGGLVGEGARSISAGLDKKAAAQRATAAATPSVPYAAPGSKGRAAYEAAQAAAYSQVNNITVNGVGMDHVAGEIDKKITQSWDSKMRDAAGQ